jgi:hypothetical protein
MGWLYVPGLDALTSVCELQPADAIAWCVTSSGKPTPRPLSWRGWKTKPWSLRLSGTILNPSTAARGAVSWMSSLRDCRASRTASLASERETMTSELCGRTSSASSESVSLPQSSSRTSRNFSTTLSLFGESYGQWVSDLLRLCYTPPQSPARSISENDSLSLLPTPTASAYGSGQNGSPRDHRDAYANPKAPSLETLVSQLPTPNCPNGGRSTKHAEQVGGSFYAEGKKVQQGLESAIELLPTPTASSATKDSKHARYGNGDLKLPGVIDLLPTPTAMDSRSSGAAGYSTESGRHSGTTLTDAVLGAASAGRRGKLNPQLSEWIMGLPRGWSSCEPLEMVSFQTWLRRRGANSSST